MIPNRWVAVWTGVLWLALAPGALAQREPRIGYVTDLPLRIPAGGTARVDVAMPVSPLMGRVEFEPVDAPDGIVLRESTTDRDRASLVLHADAARLKPGFRSTLVLRAFAERSPQSSREEPSATPRRVPLGALPAIPFEVIEK